MKTSGASFSSSSFESFFRRGRSRLPSSHRVICVVLHGKGDSLDSYIDFHRELGLFEIDYLILNAPMPFLDGRKWMNDEPRHEPTLKVVRWLLADVVAELLDFGYQAKNILWLGHSQGGRVVADFLMHSNDAYLGFVGVSTYVGFFPGWSNRTGGDATWKTPWLLTHGSNDEVIPLREIRTDVRELARARVPLVYKEFSKGHDFDHQHELPYIRSWILQQAMKPEEGLKIPSRRLERFEHRKSERKTRRTPIPET